MGPIVGAIIISRRANREGIWITPESQPVSMPAQVEMVKKPLFAVLQEEKTEDPVQHAPVEVFYTIGEPEDTEPGLVGKAESPAPV